ncbi:MAG: serine/threonine protein kinase [Candidatus Melainabacteria bacterium]|nr:serine/threonine protein kinase [Candidatus Melainabacteria bacterium]
MTEDNCEQAIKAEKIEPSVEKTKLDLSHATFEEISANERRKASLSGEEDLHVRPLIFDNCWVITERIGEGGMSVVYKARHVDLNRTVAIKVLLPHLTTNMKNLQRFRQEAVTASALSHPNLIRVENFGVTPEGRTFIVMDFVEGVSLADVIAREGKIDPVRAVFIFVQAANALQHAHERNVIHRDLKPSNIMLVNNGEDGESAKIVDFGIAKLLLDDEDQVQHLTQTGEVFGSPLYMSPEQCRGEKLDNRSDIYSMGVLMYEALTGRAPIRGANVFETMQKQLSDIPDPIVDEKAPDSLLKRLNTIVMKALEKDPSARYKEMGELETDLNNALISAEKEWKHRAKSLKKQDRNVSSKKKKIREIVAATAIGLFVCTGGLLCIREAMYDPLQSMNLERQSLFAKKFKPANVSRDADAPKLTMQMNVLILRDHAVWKEIEARLAKGDRREDDYDKITNDMIPAGIHSMKRLRDDGNYLSAIQQGDWVLSMYESLAQTDSAEYVSVFKLQAENYLGLDDFVRAYRNYEKAYETASRSLSGSGMLETQIELLYAMMQINVHERNYIAALAQAEELKKKYRAVADDLSVEPIAKRDWLALLTEEAEIERISNNLDAISGFKRVVSCWQNFLAANRAGNQYQVEEYLAKSRYGLALAQAQARDFDAAAKNIEAAYEFYRKRGQDPELTDRVKKNYLALLRKINLGAYLMQSLRS